MQFTLELVPLLRPFLACRLHPRGFFLTPLLFGTGKARRCLLSQPFSLLLHRRDLFALLHDRRREFLDLITPALLRGREGSIRFLTQLVKSRLDIFTEFFTMTPFGFDRARSIGLVRLGDSRRPFTACRRWRSSVVLLIGLAGRYVL